MFKALIQMTVITVTVPGGLWLAANIAGLGKVLKGGLALANKFVGDPVKSGARNVQGLIADKGSQSGNKAVRAAARILTGTAYPRGGRRMAMQGAERAERVKKAQEAESTYLLNRPDLFRTGGNKFREQAIIRALGGMKMEDVAKLSADSIAALLGHSNPNIQSAAHALFQRAVQNPDVQAKLKPSQIQAMYGRGPTGTHSSADGFPHGYTPVDIPPEMDEGLDPNWRRTQDPLRERARKTREKVGQWLLRRLGRGPVWPNKP